MKLLPPQTVDELMLRANALAGKTLQQLADELNLTVPRSLLRAKGWVGELLESALGTSAGNTAQPDFCQLGIELKTLPIDTKGRPLESTYVTVVPMLNLAGSTWQQSEVYQKLRCVLWVPILSERHLAIADRMIATPFLWSPNDVDMAILANDWHEITDMISLGQVEKLSGRFGTYLHVRPKAANARCLTQSYDAQGNYAKTLPRGFYLRASFTAKILAEVFGNGNG